MQYDLILLDSDDTLLDFELSERTALLRTLRQFSIEPKEPIVQCYAEINEKLWKQFERMEIDKETIQNQRFTELLARLEKNGDGIKMNQQYLENLSDEAHLLDEAKTVCEQLSRHHSLAIVTNGVSFVQHKRLKHSGLLPYISKVFVSEDIGAHKPQKEYFDAVFAEFKAVEHTRMLIVGDSLSSDILGGNQAGIDSCWYNPMNHENKTKAQPTYEIKRLSELLTLV